MTDRTLTFPKGFETLISPDRQVAPAATAEQPAAVAPTTGQLVGATMLGAEGVAPQNRWQRLRAHEDVRAGFKATLRLAANLAISTVDAFPIIGNIFSLGADATKLFKQTDFLTPDVKRRWAWWTEALEGLELFGIPMPTHLVETFMQAKADRHRFRAGFHAARTILRNEDIRVSADASR